MRSSSGCLSAVSIHMAWPLSDLTGLHNARSIFTWRTTQIAPSPPCSTSMHFWRLRYDGHLGYLMPVRTVEVTSVQSADYYSPMGCGVKDLHEPFDRYGACKLHAARIRPINSACCQVPLSNSGDLHELGTEHTSRPAPSPQTTVLCPHSH